MNKQHAALIDSLGGATAIIDQLKKLTGTAPSCTQIVSAWKNTGIYWHYRPAIAELAKAKGIEVPAGFLGPKEGKKK